MFHNRTISGLFFVLILLCSLNTAQATDRITTLSEDPSIFGRYSSNTQDLVLKGLEFVGINYRRGGTNPKAGLDCSGFVQLVFKDAVDKLLPRTARGQSKVGDAVDKNELKPGDLVFFNTMRRAFSHVGIYLGNNQFLHSPRTGKKIRIDDMNQGYWVKRYNGARRIVEHYETLDFPSSQQHVSRWMPDNGVALESTESTSAILPLPLQYAQCIPPSKSYDIKIIR